MTILHIDGLDLRYATDAGPAAALTDIRLRVAGGEAIGIVGESGCGKSTLLKAIMGVMPRNATITGGAIRFDGTDLVTAGAEAWRRARWKGIAMIAQSALNALNPVKRVGAQIAEAITAHETWPKAEVEARVAELLALVGVDPGRARDYPHQFSGGMRQRVLIAMALLSEPRLLIADEPGTALDVTTQAQILKLLKDLVEERGLALLMITHNLGVVRETSDYVYVMNKGEIVEHSPCRDLFSTPKHAYTQALIDAVPRLTGARS